MSREVVVAGRIFDGTDESIDWLLPQLKSGEIGRTVNKLYIKTAKGTMVANKGDYVVRLLSGEIVACNPFQFYSY